MGGSDQKDEFNARLARIRGQRGEHEAQDAAPKAARRAAAPAPATGGRRRRANGLRGALSAVALLAAGMGLYAGIGILRGVDLPLNRITGDFVSRTVVPTPRPEAYDGLLRASEKTHREYDAGWDLPPPYVAAPGRNDLTLAAFTVPAETTPGTAPDAPTDTAPRVRPFDVNATCTLRRPRADEVVRNVRLVEPALYSRIHLFSDAELAKAVTDRIEGLTRSPRHYKTAATARGRMGMIDVFVTDRSAPVYLVLQTFNRDVIWNIHLAPGVRLSHVAMIGNKSGFLAPEGDYDFEALRIGDFVPRGSFNKNETIRDCMIVPYRKPQPDWRINAKLQAPATGDIYRDQFRLMTQGHDAFAAWYRKTLGVAPETNVTSALSAANVLSGPLPESPLRLPSLRQTLTAQVLHVTRADHVVFGSDRLEALHRDLLLAATGGDLSILTPAPVEAAAKEVTQ